MKSFHRGQRISADGVALDLHATRGCRLREAGQIRVSQLLATHMCSHMICYTQSVPANNYLYSG